MHGPLNVKDHQQIIITYIQFMGYQCKANTSWRAVIENFAVKAVVLFYKK